MNPRRAAVKAGWRPKAPRCPSCGMRLTDADWDRPGCPICGAPFSAVRQGSR